MSDTIEITFKKHYKELCIAAHFYLADFDEAQDVVQGIFVKLIEQGKTMEISNLRGYLWSAVRNESLKRLKKRQVHRSIDPNSLFYEETDTDERENMAIQRKITLYNKIDALPEQCKKIFLLCTLDDLKYQEVADTLNISVNTVKTQMKKAFKILRTTLKNLNLLFLIFRKKKNLPSF